MPYQVSEISEDVVGHPARGGRFSFHILDLAGMSRSICTLSYTSRSDAEQARAAALKMMEKAVSAS
jgi:hypothetical protein